ncbi:MAG TPA: hypothetical protein IGQ16_05840 [Thermosynechococcus sp. M3746_W2019_013]|uniref:hypothetical protein n=1 Tax=Thermosynechococcus sp. M3746_W2019_013 TaxID=2747806 RepID=UPI0019FFE7B2|nr:hypothetical protein [Thermosynechococcus sp. M3746_W2019_013]HIK23177.1 hypothetical protein [Thermosynechococcus sp. M3746_W2019_013]
MEKPRGYNERIFSGYLRSYFHTRRYIWLKSNLLNLLGKDKISSLAILEIGCGDLRTLEFTKINPKIYVGIDSNWENLLDQAKSKYRGLNNIILIEAKNPSKITQEFNLFNNDFFFDVCISLETFEHLPKPILEEYVEFISKYLNGLIFITVPIEFGPIFLIKHLVKRFKYKDDSETFKYKLSEIFFASIGITKKVKRIEGGHKGFDYRVLLEYLSSKFELIKVEGIPFNYLPAFMNFQVGMIFKTKH